MTVASRMSTDVDNNASEMSSQWQKLRECPQRWTKLRVRCRHNGSSFENSQRWTKLRVRCRHNGSSFENVHRGGRNCERDAVTMAVHVASRMSTEVDETASEMSLQWQ